MWGYLVTQPCILNNLTAYNKSYRIKNKNKSKQLTPVVNHNQKHFSLMKYYNMLTMKYTKFSMTLFTMPDMNYSEQLDVLDELRDGLDQSMSVIGKITS